MARISGKKDPWHKIKLVTDNDAGEIILVVGGRRAYLWAGRNDGVAGCVTATGAATLRKLARAILAEVGDK